jgi:hypothetical protein
MWWVTNPKAGINAIALQRALGLGSYQTAWAWLHKLRRAMVRPARDRLSGRVEVDETYVGGEEEGVEGRKTYKKTVVAIAIEIHLRLAERNAPRMAARSAPRPDGLCARAF